MNRTASAKPGKSANILLAIATVLALFPGFSGAADITVHTDRNPAVLQESFQLIFEATGGVDDDPDFSPLEKDFQVLSTSTSTSMNIVNTQITRTKQWRLTLMPVNAGNLVIPAISFGRDKSPQTSLTVIQAGNAAPGQDSLDIFIDVEAVPVSAYVQSEVIYTVKLYRAVATSNETLSEPDVSQGSAIIELLDADRSYDTFVQGRRYAVFERSYAIYPQVSGNLLIGPARFQGQLSAASPFSLDPFGPGGRTVVRQSEAVELQVDPVPAAYRDGHWLPAKDVKVTEKWSKDPLDLLPNEPVTRTITLAAQGLTASQLPEIQEVLPPGFRQYPDQPELDNSKTAEGITGMRQQKNAIIPARPGEYTLPEISLPWWNTETQTLEYAVLPERRVQVTAAAPDATIDTPLFPAPAIDTPVQEQAAPETGETSVAPTDASAGISIWQWLTCILAVAWLATLGYILKNRNGPRAESPPSQTENARETRKALERACRDDDPERAKTALLQWARIRPQGSPASSLGDLEKQVDEKLAAEIRNLSRRLYSRSAEPWRGEPLRQAFLQEEKSSAVETTSERGKLEPLYRL
ncbi:MAG: BatD family protein [Gammaproteobacteria bacterium]|nr:BatD family protein [Gammaproteobacteria bacterium]